MRTQIKGDGIDREVAGVHVCCQILASVGGKIQKRARVIRIGHDDAPRIAFLIKHHKIGSERVGNLPGKRNTF